MCGDVGECLLLDNVYCMEYADSYHNMDESYYNDGDGGMGDATFSNSFECAAACANNPECTRGYFYGPSQYCYFFGIDGYADTCSWAECDDCTGFECEKTPSPTVTLQPSPIPTTSAPSVTLAPTVAQALNCDNVRAAFTHTGRRGRAGGGRGVLMQTPPVLISR